MDFEYDVYIATGLRRERLAKRNSDVLRMCEEMKLRVFLPSLSGSQKASDIYERNICAISKSKVFLALTEGAGEGVYLEIGYAFGLAKPILVCGNTILDYGKMVEGLCESDLYNAQFCIMEDLSYALQNMLASLE